MKMSAVVVIKMSDMLNKENDALPSLAEVLAGVRLNTRMNGTIILPDKLLFTPKYFHDVILKSVENTVSQDDLAMIDGFLEDADMVDALIEWDLENDRAACVD